MIFAHIPIPLGVSGPGDLWGHTWCRGKSMIPYVATMHVSFFAGEEFEDVEGALFQ